MIALTRLSGSTFALNCDLIERIDATPDSVITLVDGKKYVVAEPLAEIIAAIREHRAYVVAASSRLADTPPGVLPGNTPLAAVAELRPRLAKDGDR